MITQVKPKLPTYLAAPPKSDVKQAALPTKPASSQDVITLTQELVRINSGPDNLVAGENQVCDRVQQFADENGLQVQRLQTVRGRPMLIVTLPGSKPELPTVGFVHHSDVVGIKADWKLGEPFSGDIVQDRHGRDVVLGRGSLDTKGPTAQVLMAMKRLKESGRQPERSVQLFLFPDEETGGREGAWYLAKNQPELFSNVGYWVVEGAGIMSKETLAGVGDVKQDTPLLAVAQKYSVPCQMVLKQPADPEQAVETTLAALKRLDDFIDDRDWTFLGDDEETDRSFERFGDLVGGFKGWLLKNFWWTDFVQDRMGPELSATNRTDLARTDFYLSHNSAGNLDGPNVKPSSATAILRLEVDPDERERATEIIRDAVGEKFELHALPDNDEDNYRLRLTLPQENYDGTNHGSIPDRGRDAIDVTNRALSNARKKLWWRGWSEKMEVVDYYTNKSTHDPEESARPVRAHVTLDLRLAVDDDRDVIFEQLREVMGDQFELQLVGGPEELDAHVRRLRSDSPLFEAAEGAIHQTYGDETQVIFANTTVSNDVRYLMQASPESEALTFVPILMTENGAHGPDEAVTVDSLRSGVDWTVTFIEKLAKA